MLACSPIRNKIAHYWLDVARNGAIIGHMVGENPFKPRSREPQNLDELLSILGESRFPEWIFVARDYSVADLKRDLRKLKDQ